MDSPKFSGFDILETSYKTINGHKIEAYILAPKNASPGKHPLLVKFHGGGLVTGDALYPDWSPQWLIDYSLHHSAIIIAANHRLMPESSGLDILEDLSDFWLWLRDHSQAHLTAFKPGLEVALSQIIIHGESAGGYLGIQSALTQPAGTIKAVIATYPMIDMESRFFTECYEKSIFGAPMLPPSMLNDYLASMQPGKIVTSAIPPARQELSLLIIQQGQFAEIFGKDERLYPLRGVEMVEQVPMMFIFHGVDDSAVPVEGSVKFVEKVTQKFGKEKIILHTQPGEHGFDVAATLDAPWLHEALGHVTELWLN